MLGIFMGLTLIIKMVLISQEEVRKTKHLTSLGYFIRNATDIIGNGGCCPKTMAL